MRALILSLTALLAASQLHAIGNDPFFIGQKAATYVELNNRVVAVVNETPISVYDVMKKMDFIFYRQFPEYTNIPEARHEFYRFNWKRVLSELIDKELIVADAKENKLPVTNGDVRQEMESLFGPNIISNLDKIGMTFQEAQKIVLDDITIRRMLYIRVNSKAINSVTPAMIADSYETYCKERAEPAMWNYFVVTIRDEEAGEKTAALAHKLLSEEKIEAGTLEEKLNSVGISSGARTVTVSDLYRHSEKELSPAYMEALAALEPHHFSAPVMQKSRATGQEVYRIFYLDSKEGGIIPTFKEIEQKLKDELINKRIDEETSAYLSRLRKYYNVNQKEIEASLSPSYEPFFLK